MFSGEDKTRVIIHEICRPAKMFSSIVEAFSISYPQKPHITGFPIENSTPEFSQRET